MQAGRNAWHMERLKRRLIGAVVDLIADDHGVALLGLPPADDLEGQLTAEGLESLLSVHGFQVRLRLGTGTDVAPQALPPGCTVISLRAQPTEIAALPRPTKETRLVILASDVPAGLMPEILSAAPEGYAPVLWFTHPDAQEAAQPPSGVRACLLPDPAHVLWGLLDHYPQGIGTLRIEGVPDWPSLVPPRRLSPLRAVERAYRRTPRLVPASALRSARRRALEGARRALARHAEIETDRLQVSILAALLGRSVRARGSQATAVERYWDAWRCTSIRSAAEIPA